MGENGRWNFGDAVVLRGVWKNQIWFACPVRVVQDLPELVALYWRSGTRTKQRGIPHTDQVLWKYQENEKLEIYDRIWTRTDVLCLAVPNNFYSIWAMWDEGTRDFRCWYVNFERPFARTPVGFDTIDYELDIVIGPNQVDWRWKDEAEFEEAVVHGYLSDDLAKMLRSEGERIIERLQADRSPFCDGWENWSPPVDWTIPELPTGWDCVPKVEV